MQAKAHFPQPSQRSRSIAIPNRFSAPGNFGCSRGTSMGTRFPSGNVLERASWSSASQSFASGFRDAGVFLFGGSSPCLRQPKREKAANAPARSFKNDALDTFIGDTSRNPSPPAKIRVRPGDRQDIPASESSGDDRGRFLRRNRGKSCKRRPLSHERHAETRRATGAGS